ncbi:MAG: VWA domain-containing protein [Armatimonadota bacterium]
MIEYPIFLGLIGIVPIILVWGAAAIRRQRRELKLFLKTASLEERVYTVRSGFALAMLLIFTAAVFLSLAGFTHREREGLVRSESVSVVFCVDISRSMLAADVGESRLSTVKGGMRRIIRNNPNGRYGIVAFKGDAVTMVPLTGDFRALDLFIQGMSPALISSPGTDLGAGVEEAVRAFPPGIPGHRIIILFSDGESTRGRSDPKGAVSEGIPIVVVPVGTESGSAIELGEETYVRGPEGEKIISRIHTEELEKIAEATGGIYLTPEELSSGTPLDRLLEPWMEDTVRRGYRMVRVDRYRIFLFPAFLALIGYCFIRRLA